MNEAMERFSFERWAQTTMRDHYDLDRMTNRPEFYRHWKTQHAWEGWKARAQWAGELEP
jgi:hypothetical protein